MNKLWVFGDSFSSGLGLDKFYDSGWRKSYIDWKGYVPHSYYELLADYFKLVLVNHAMDGQSNYHIFQNFCEVSPYIKDDDYVIIQWSEVTRFRLVDNNAWQGVGSWHLTNKANYLPNISSNTLHDILINRMENPTHYAGEIHAWMSLINKSLTKCKVLFWTPFDDPSLYKVLGMSHLSTIRMETNDEVSDSHFGEKGHLDLFHQLKKEFENYKKII
jgi:hypothetical protein